MADDAYLFLLPDNHPRIGAALAAVGSLECAETPAVRGWLSAHGVPASSERIRILPADSEILIPEGAERLPIPLSEQEQLRIHEQCAPHSVTEMERELLTFRETTEHWEALVHRALTAGIPAPRIAELTGLDPQEVGRLAQS
ncbi:DUF6003 family protein [Streptomyces mexicanus]|jgi:hypothetical protein|uniref:DUF6003 family protein n=1 Tax=Streptomyces mexicanus TaxID=178566 RepID=UPI0031E6C563